MSIEERIRLDKIEYYNLLKSYLEDVFEAFCNRYCRLSEVKELFGYLAEYKEELEQEIYYLNYILDNIDRIDEQALERVLAFIDKVNESTYNYYDGLGEKYVNKSYTFAPIYHLDRKYPKFAHNELLIDEIKGLTLTSIDIDNYFNHATPYLYLKERTKHMYTDDKSFYGVFTEMRDNRITAINVFVPQVVDLGTALVNVHEYKHGMDLYKYIGKEQPSLENFEMTAKREEYIFRKEYVRNK